MKTLLALALAIVPLASASAAGPARPAPSSSNVAVVTGFGAQMTRGSAPQLAQSRAAQMASNTRRLVQSVDGTGKAVGTGRGGAAHAVLFLELPAGGRVTTAKAGVYHANQPEAGGHFVIHGAGNQGVPAAIAGQTSVHDLSSVAGLNSRESSDHFGIYFDGKLAHKGPAGPAALGNVTIPFGTKQVTYQRLSASGGVVGGVSGYPAGREFNLSWQ